MNRNFLALGFILLLFLASCASKTLFETGESIAYVAPVYTYEGVHMIRTHQDLKREEYNLHSLDSSLNRQKKMLSIEKRIEVDAAIEASILDMFEKLATDSLISVPKPLQEVEIETNAEYVLFFYDEMKESNNCVLESYCWKSKTYIAVMDINTREIVLYDDRSNKSLTSRLKTLK